MCDYSFGFWFAFAYIFVSFECAFFVFVSFLLSIECKTDDDLLMATQPIQFIIVLSPKLTVNYRNQCISLWWAALCVCLCFDQQMLYKWFEWMPLHGHFQTISWEPIHIFGNGFATMKVWLIFLIFFFLLYFHRRIHLIFIKTNT